MNETAIQWTWAVDPTTGALIPDSGWTWNPLVGCRKVSTGCKNCYAERLIATRLSQHQVYRGLAVMKDPGPQFTGEHRLIVDRLDEPLRKRNPRGGKSFVNDLGDLFYTSRVESGKIAVVGSDKLAAVGLALRVSLDWLVRGVGGIDVEGHGADTCVASGDTSTG